MLFPPAGGVGAASVQLVPAAPQVGQQGRVLLRHLPPPLSAHCTVKNSHNQHYRTTERASCSPARPIWPGGSASPPALTRLLVPRTMYNVRRNILLPSTMCAGIYSHTYKHTTMYAHLSPATPSPHSRAQWPLDTSAATFPQSGRSLSLLTHIFTNLRPISNFSTSFFSQRTSIKTKQSYWWTRPLRFQHFTCVSTAKQI